MDIDFTIKQNSRGYILIRENGDYEQHAHLKDEATCHTLIKLIKNNKLPTSSYLRGSCIRLLDEEEYAMLKEKKQKYYNVNKGVKRK